MGEIADMMIDGFLDSETGELLDGDAPGYPRSRNWGKGKFTKPSPKNTPCPRCGKKFRGEFGVRQHLLDKHGAA